MTAPAFQPRNRRLPAQTEPAFVSQLNQPWWADDGNPATGVIWAWGSVSTSWRVMIEADERFTLCSDRGAFLRWPNDARGRKGRIRSWPTKEAAADYAESGEG